MNGAGVHLAVAHLPVAGSFFALALLAAGAVRRDRSLWAAGCVSAIAVALGASTAWSSGSLALDTVHSWLDPGGSAAADRHEVFGIAAAVCAALAGVLALRDLLEGIPRRAARGFLLVLALATVVLTTVAGATGGQIRHRELREMAPSVESPLDSEAMETAG